MLPPRRPSGPLLLALTAVSLLAGYMMLPGESRLPMLEWPIGWANHDGVFVQLGPDTDSATGSWTDWECYPQFTYDGHRGTDIMAYNFRLMDQGVPVVAAAPGLVTWVVSDQFDRNYWTPYIGQPNGLNIRHADGSSSQYFHLRQHSISVVPGDRVESGQFIGFIGSSGSSPNPHLHFELWENGISRDPNQGPCNPRLSLWSTEFDHPGGSDFTLLDWDVFLDTDLAGAENNNYLGDKRLKNRPFRPLTVAASEPTLGVWVQMQGQIGAVYEVRVLDHAGNEFARQSKGISFSRSVQWHVLYFDFDAASMEGPEGEWQVELLRDGHPTESRRFQVADQTTFPLRFFPLAGRTLLHTGSTLRDTLRVRSGSGTVAYELVDAPAGVSVESGVTIVSDSAVLPTRNTHFKVAATDSRGLADTMYYHLVNPNGPLEGVATSVRRPDVPTGFRIQSAYPNPFVDEVTILLTTRVSADTELTVYDMLGREVRRRSLGHLAAGDHSISVARDRLAPGNYLAVIRAGSGTATHGLTVLP
ncbi:MAG: peptidoglycan DD-metalloendopeptidase family protein [Rhodothermales bacterium]|nr:peptidoglycan DD-metalloendopeptidase family protein [Rhodothermales bacterium]